MIIDRKSVDISKDKAALGGKSSRGPADTQVHVEFRSTKLNQP